MCFPQKVDVTNRSARVDLANYVYSGEWELIEINVVRNEVFYACCQEPYPDVTFYVVMRRRTLYYLFNIIFPCLWLTILSLLGFWLPPDSGEKITLGITVLLAFSVFMLLIAESMPATSEFVPLIGGLSQMASAARVKCFRYTVPLFGGVQNAPFWNLLRLIQ